MTTTQPIRVVLRLTELFAVTLRAPRVFTAGLACLAGSVVNGAEKYDTPWLAEREAAKQTLVVNCVFLGNSVAEAGFDVPMFIAAWPKRAGLIAPINLALRETTPEEHGIILLHTLALPVKLKYLIYGFVDDQLITHSAETEPMETGAIFSARHVASVYTPRPPTKWRQTTTRSHAPKLALRASLWDEIDLLRWSLDELALETDEVTSFNRRCASTISTRSGFSIEVREIIRLGREHGATVILVEMPTTTAHRQAFHQSPVWARMHRYIEALAWEEGAVFLTGSDWVTDDGFFMDASHLNEAGAKLFSSRLAMTLARIDAAGEPIDIASR